MTDHGRIVSEVDPGLLLRGHILMTFIGAAVVFSLIALGRLAWRKLRRSRRTP